MIPQIEPQFDRDEADALSEYILRGGWGTEFRKTIELEGKIARFLNVKHACMTTSGTQALILTLMACGVGSGDYVIVPSLTMIATANAVRLLGAVPYFVDVGSTGCLDPYMVMEQWQPKVKAVIYVSLNGRARGLNTLAEWCESKEVILIEDACQSFGSRTDEDFIGTIGDVGCFSFSPHKIISTGQGGCVVTNNNHISRKVRAIKDFGRPLGGVDIHPEFGINGKFTDFQAVIGLEQMNKLPERLLAKKRIFAQYRDALEGYVQFIDTEQSEVPWFVDIYTTKRKKLMQHLTVNNIGVRPMYPPVHSQPCYREDWILPTTKKLSLEGLWLPSSPHLSDDEIKTVCKTVEKFFT